MAKKDVQDFRIDFIEAVGRTDNLKILRTIANQMEHRSYFFNLNMLDLLEIMNEGIKKVKQLLGSSAKSFTPLIEINKLSVETYFRKINQGYKELEERKKTLAHLDKQRADYNLKLSKYKQKGKFDKVKIIENCLFCIEFPTENIEKINNSLQILEERHNQGVVDDYQYQTILKDLKKSKRLSESALKDLKSLKKIDNIDYFNKMQEEVRNFLCYTFFDKNGKTPDSPNRFLMTYDGDIKADFEHMLLLYNYLKSVGYENIKEIRGVLYYTALEQFFRDVEPFVSKEIKGIYLKQSPTEFYSESINGYYKKYMSYYLAPKGYKSYIFEPKNLLSQSFIAAIDGKNLTIDNMVLKYQDAQQIIRNRKNGLFYSFLDIELENKMIKKIVTNDFPLDEMDGEYKDLLLNEFRERRDTFGASDSFNVMTDMYSRVVKPYALEVLGSYIRAFCYNLVSLKDKDMIYIYYISPERFAIAVRDDVTDEILKEVFSEKFLAYLEEVKKPILKDILNGKYL